MTPLTIALTLLWLAAAFAAARYLGRRYLHEAGRADAIAGAVVIAAIAGMALDPFRTGGGAAPPAGSAAGAPAPTASADPNAIAALFGAEFAAWQSGNVSPANYTPSGFAASRTLLKRFIPILRALGPVRRERFVATSAQNGLVSYEYRFDCANGSELMGANLDASGKIASLGFATAPPGG